MGLHINLRHLQKRPLTLAGQLTAAELDLDPKDELIQVRTPLAYDLEAQLLDQGVLLTGWLALTLDCQCVRCLKPHTREVALQDWTCHLALEGEEKVLVTNDCVDLTPYLREDILLAFPQHPLCNPECSGLARPRAAQAPGGPSESNPASSAWAELNKLRF